MKIFVTGGAGYIGSHVVRQLTEAGHEAVVMDNLSTGFEDSLIHGEKLVQADIGDEKVLREIFKSEKFDCVMHFAGSIVVPESVSDPAKYYKNNTLKTLVLAEAAGRAGIGSFIFSSTASVYGANPQGLASEDSPIQPCNPYGWSKAMSEKILEDLSGQFGFGLGILRYFNVAGADPESRMGQKTKNATHLVKICCEAACGMRPQVEIFGDDYHTKDGTCVRDFIHVEDLATAHLKLLDYLKTNKKLTILNAGYSQGHSVKDVVERAKVVTGKNFKSIISPRRAGDPDTIVAVADKIGQVLNWKPQFNNLDKIILDAWHWEKKWSGK